MSRQGTERHGAQSDLVVDWASKLNPAGGLVAAIQAIYKVVKWVVDNRDKLQKLAESVIQGVQALVNGSGVDKVAEYVEKGLAGAFTAAADYSCLSSLGVSRLSG